MSRARWLNWPGAVAVVALVTSVGTTSYAAGVLVPRASVGQAQLRTGAATGAKLSANSVTGAKVRDHSLLSTDLEPGQLPRGVPGPQGPAGRTGAQGPSGAAGAAGPRGLAGSQGSVGSLGVFGGAGAKGPVGDPGPAGPPSVVYERGPLVTVGANEVGTEAVTCPSGMRVLSGTAEMTVVGSTTVQLKIFDSQPDPTGTGWTVTVVAANVAGRFDTVAVCAAVR
jgi:hypothetical protein